MRRCILIASAMMALDTTMCPWRLSQCERTEFTGWSQTNRCLQESVRWAGRCQGCFCMGSVGTSILYILQFPIGWASLSVTVLSAENAATDVWQIMATQKCVICIHKAYLFIKDTCSSPGINELEKLPGSAYFSASREITARLWIGKRINFQ